MVNIVEFYNWGLTNKEGTTMSEFIHLHVHSDSRLIDGMMHGNDILEKAKQYEIVKCESPIYRFFRRDPKILFAFKELAP
jgi:hypothetical protein